MLDPLLPKEQKLFDCIRGYILIHQYSPSTDELVTLFGTKSKNQIQRLLSSLQNKQYISSKGLPRTYQLLAGNMPLRGVVQAGGLVEQPTDLNRYIDVSGSHYTIHDYALQVEGDSMIDSHICDGDFVVMRPVKEIDRLKPGTITAVWVEGEGTTLKHIYQEKTVVILKPANPNYEPKEYDPEQVRPQGILVGLHRFYDDRVREIKN